MKILLLLACACLSHTSMAQTSETPRAPEIPTHRYGNTKQIIVSVNTAVATSHFTMTALESEIRSLEDTEVNALLKRDTATVKKIWAKDFTLDEVQTEMVTSGNPIPYYIFYSRTVEHIDLIDSLVFSKGSESFRLLHSDATLGEPIQRSYFHTWQKQNGIWKLIMKTH